MSTKICFKCKEELSIDMFYKHKEMKDGHLNKCKNCTKKDVKENRKDNIEYYKEYDRNRSNHTERIENNKKRMKILQAVDEHLYTEKLRKRCNNYKEKYPNKYKAKNAVNNAARGGKIIKPSCCENCSVYHNTLHGHHESYDEDQRLQVVWLCRDCHTRRYLVINDYTRNKLPVPTLNIPF